MERIRQDMSGFTMPTYVEEILTQNYCPSFMRMSIVRDYDSYVFNYKPDAYEKIDVMNLSLYDKLLLLRTLITMSENTSNYLINADNYLLEPELIYSKGPNIGINSVRLMYYPDIKKLDFRYKLVLFADRILNKDVKEEREMADSIREVAEPGDINRIKMFLDKNLLRLEKRMLDGQIIWARRA